MVHTTNVVQYTLLVVRHTLLIYSVPYRHPYAHTHACLKLYVSCRSVVRTAANITSTLSAICDIRCDRCFYWWWNLPTEMMKITRLILYQLWEQFILIYYYGQFYLQFYNGD